MRSLNSGAVLFNLGGGALLLTIAAYVGHNWLQSSEIQPCSARYAPGLRYSLTSDDGSALTPLELQARSGMRGWGVLENARIEPGNGPDGANLNVKFATSGSEDEPARSGVGFLWQPSNLGKASSACLSYSVFFPSKFAFKAGHLPGLMSTPDTSDLDAPAPSSGFVARVGWMDGGAVGMDVRQPADQGFWQGASSQQHWPVDRWVRVEQEIALNGHGRTGGALRMWVDGRLSVENEEAPITANRPAGFGGVVADIGYADPATASTAVVKVSPFVIQWQ